MLAKCPNARKDEVKQKLSELVNKKIRAKLDALLVPPQPSSTLTLDKVAQEKVCLVPVFVLSRSGLCDLCCVLYVLYVLVLPVAYCVAVVRLCVVWLLCGLYVVVLSVCVYHLVLLRINSREQ